VMRLGFFGSGHPRQEVAVPFLPQEGESCVLLEMLSGLALCLFAGVRPGGRHGAFVKWVEGSRPASVPAAWDLLPQLRKSGTMRPSEDRKATNALSPPTPSGRASTWTWSRK